MTTLKHERDYGGFAVYVSADGCIGVVENIDAQRYIKRFDGETAHMDAHRYASDLATRERMEAPWHI